MSGLLNIAKCLYDAIHRLEKKALKAEEQGGPSEKQELAASLLKVSGCVQCCFFLTSIYRLVGGNSVKNVTERRRLRAPFVLVPQRTISLLQLQAKKGSGRNGKKAFAAMAQLLQGLSDGEEVRYEVRESRRFVSCQD